MAASKTGRKRKLKHPTWVHPEGSGIKVAEVANKTGGDSFGVSYQVRVPSKLLGVPGKREFTQYLTKADAFKHAEDRFLALKGLGTQFAAVPPAVQRQAAMAWGILSKHNQQAGINLHLLDVVEAGIRALCPEGGRKTLSDVVAELLNGKEARHAAGKLDSSTLHDFRVRAKKIEAEFGSRFVGDIQHTEIAAWLRKIQKEGGREGEGLSWRSVLNYRLILSGIMKHAKARQYCHANPFDRFTLEDLKGLGGTNDDRNLDDINILSVDESRRLLNAALESGDTGMLATVVLRLFCGIRTAEVCKLDWSEVHWLDAKPYVHIPAGKAKKRRIRHVDIPENACAWLKLCNPPAKGAIVPGSGNARKDSKAYCARFQSITKAAGIGRENAKGGWESEWESNDTRHSFGSYHYALHGDALKTAAQMGHKGSDDVLFAHYRQLVREEAAAEFFGILPDPEAGKLTTFPKAAAG
ncbi:MAG: tyrosine-type recombinase/integrase [Opitutaceae bacterium]|nr:tyrosine-type recombinase/integrase [Opitutaceae bacterium]